jgi:uncharacterized protein (DUF1697 family)
MTTYIALLRGINVGGHQKVTMADLRDMATHLGLAEAQTLLQSGNLVFRTAARSATQLEHLLEAEAIKRLALQSDFIVRTAEEWKTIAARNPFLEQAERDPSHLVVMFFKDAPKASDIAALRAVITGPEIVHADGRQAYITYPDGIGDSRLTNSLIERKLGVRGTARNWNTVLKLEALAIR